MKNSFRFSDYREGQLDRLTKWTNNKIYLDKGKKSVEKKETKTYVTLFRLFIFPTTINPNNQLI